MIKTRYVDNFRSHDGKPTYYRTGDLQFLDQFISLSDEEEVRRQKRLQTEFDLKIAVLRDDDV